MRLRPNNELFILLILSIASAVLLFLSRNNFLFWDTVQFTGMHGNHFYSNGVSSLLLPDSMDSGHPPTFGLLISAMWRIFGKTLAVSHGVMLPFIVGIIYEAIRIGKHLFQRKFYFFPLLIFVCPFFLGHMTLVSPDIVLVYGFLMGMRGVLLQNKWLIMISSIILSLTSMRGVAMVLALYLYHIITRVPQFEKNKIKKYLRLLIPYLPGVIFFCLYFFYHFWAKGWVGHHEASLWASSFALVDFTGFLKNIARYMWILCDHGMVIIWAIIIFHFRSLFILRGRLIWLAIIIDILLFLMVAPYQGLLNHRYFLPLQLTGIILALQVLLAGKKWQTLVFVFVFVALGNLWIYPKTISQGWDSTMAHYPIYGLESQMSKFLLDHDISKTEVGTAFPLRSSSSDLFLKRGDYFHQYNPTNDRYILYSNVMNDFKDNEIESFFNQWKEVEKVQSMGICLILFEKL